MPIEIIILAAGQGKRMRSELPKVLHPIGGKPLLLHLLETTSKSKPEQIHIVVGYGKSLVVETIENLISSSKTISKINWVEQTEQRGTGHAVMQTLPYIDPDSTVLILNGDVPLISLPTLRKISKSGNSLNLLTTSLLDPKGLGRIIRNSKNHVVGIVEDKDANPAQKEIREVNTNCMSMKASHLLTWLPALKCSNAQKEYYLTGIIPCAVDNGVQVKGIASQCVAETMGVNNKSDLGKLERLYQARIADEVMARGVTLMDASRFDVRGTCKFGNDCVVDINVILEGNVNIGNRVTIGPNSLIRNVRIGDDSVIEANSVIDNATIGRDCRIGPFARIRPETILKDNVRIGNFVEIKKSNIKDNSKVNHLSYVGDSQVGTNVNIGAGVITCNYDGANKHQTVIGDDVFVGSDSQLIAPVKIGDGATVGAGATITENIKPNSLAVSRIKQKSIDNWKRPTKKTAK